MTNEYYVYIYLDPRKPGNYIFNNLNFNYEPFYVGKGKGIRILKGLDDPNNNISKKLKIQQIREFGLEPIIMKIHDELSENFAFELEKQVIEKIGKRNLVNKSKGSTSYKKKLNLFRAKVDNNIVVNVIGIASDFYYLHEGSKLHKTLFLEAFYKC